MNQLNDKEKDFDPYLIDDSEFEELDKMKQSFLNSLEELSDSQSEK